MILVLVLRGRSRENKAQWRFVRRSQSRLIRRVKIDRAAAAAVAAGQKEELCVKVVVELFGMGNFQPKLLRLSCRYHICKYAGSSVQQSNGMLDGVDLESQDYYYSFVFLFFFVFLCCSLLR